MIHKLFCTSKAWRSSDKGVLGIRGPSVQLILNMAVAKIVLGVLGVASYYRGSETRARIGAAIAVVLVASIYADVAIPLEFELDKRGRATDVPVPLDLTSLKFLGKLALVVPLLAALAAHLAEPGLLTKDKSKDQ